MPPPSNLLSFIVLFLSPLLITSLPHPDDLLSSSFSSDNNLLLSSFTPAAPNNPDTLTPNDPLLSSSSSSSSTPPLFQTDLDLNLKPPTTTNNNPDLTLFTTPSGPGVDLCPGTDRLALCCYDNIGCTLSPTCDEGKFVACCTLDDRFARTYKDCDRVDFNAAFDPALPTVGEGAFRLDEGDHVWDGNGGLAPFEGGGGGVGGDFGM